MEYTYITSFLLKFKHWYSHHLYELENDQLVTFKLGTRSTTRSQTTYINVPYLSDVIFHTEDFSCVDIHSHKKGLAVLGSFPPPYMSWTTTPPNSLQEYFQNSLHTSLQDICRRAVFPPDNGYKLMQTIKQSNKKKIFASSNASLRNGRSTHAWVISTGQISDLSDPNMHIRGAGSIHGHKNCLSSCRGELQGITAITIITNLISDLFLPLARCMLSVIILGLFRNVQGNISNPSEATDNQTVTYT